MAEPRRSNRSRFDGARAARPRVEPPIGHLPHGPSLLDDLKMIALASLIGGVAIYLVLAFCGWLP